MSNKFKFHEILKLGMPQLICNFSNVIACEASAGCKSNSSLELVSTTQRLT